jgi:ferredoxin-NADP reductase
VIPGKNSGTKVTERAPIGGWSTATVRLVDHPIARAVRLRLEVPDRVEHLPGQHYVVRLTAPDGYVAQRSYSIASPPSEELVELFVERLVDGEVSGYLAEVVEPGDRLEVRGPIGGWFVWRGDTPAVGLAGGSGVVPFIAMLRHAAHRNQRDLLRLMVSVQTLADLPYAEELAAQQARIVLTRQDAPDGRPRGRLAAADLDGLTGQAGMSYFVCGSEGFAESASDLLVAAGIDAHQIRVERFGPTG